MRSLEGLVGELARLGTDVRVLTTNSNGHDKLDMPRGWTSYRNVPVRYMRRWVPPSGTPMFASACFQEAKRVDVVHVTGLFSIVSMQALGASLFAKRPVVLSPRGVLEPEALKLGRSAEKRAWLRAFGPLLSRVTLFHATSEEERRSIERALGVRVPTVIVPNGADLPPAEALERREPFSDSRPRIGFVGRIHPIKALEQLVRACALLRDRGLDFELRLAGPIQDRGYYEYLGRQIDDIALRDRVVFEGEVLGERKDAFYSSCRVVALVSRSENFGNVVVEALAFGTPVVASQGTPWQALETYGAGRWVENDPGNLAGALEPYLQSPELAARAGRNGRTMVEERFTWTAVARSMSEAYSEAILRANSPST